ncbi:MAG: hypothetical protein WAU47_04410 [Desulfobaccales bacterium]
MRKWVLMALGVALVSLASQNLAAAGGGMVTGVISNWYQVKERISDKAFFQLVKKEEQLKSSTNKEGLAAIVSNLPQVSLRSTGGFQVNLGNLPPGEYFIALQRGLASPPILVKDGSPLIIKIPGKFPLNVGNVKLEMPLGMSPPKHHMEVVK